MIVSRFLKRVGLIAIAGCLAIALAQGQVVVFSNLTTPDQVHGVQIFKETGVGSQTAAAQFTPSGNFNLVDAQVMVTAEPSGSPNFNVWIAADAGGLPGTFIEQIGFNLQATAPFNPNPGSSNGSVITANSIATPLALTSGTKYWLVVTPGVQPFIGLNWDGGGSSAVPLTYNSSPTFNSGWAAPINYAIQFRIDGTPTGPVGPSPTPTPLPPSVILTLTGLASAGLYQWHRRRLNS